jgi:Protein of unknown function (DUF2917)
MNVSVHSTHATLLSDPWTWLQQVLSPLQQSAASASLVRHLEKGDTFRLDDPQMHDLACLQGTLWVTQDQDPEDHILERGERYSPGSAVCMLVHAMSDARVAVTRRGGAR